MNNSRRNFLRATGAAGLGLALTNLQQTRANTTTPGIQYNMCGHRSPKLDTVRIGFVGLGNRGPQAVLRMNRIAGVSIAALCDIRNEKVQAAAASLKGSPHHPRHYSGTEYAWKKMCDSPDLDLIYICTPWHLHAPIAVYAMQQGKHVALEVPAAKTLDECWQLVETSEKTKQHCIILENCCYDFFELLTLQLVRQGWLGEIVHGEGAYIHSLLEGNFSKDKYYQQWRLKENLRNGNLYPTHGIGPVAQVMNINRGDRFDYLVSISSNDFQMQQMATALAKTDATYAEYSGKRFRGNMNTSIIRTLAGRTIMLQHDVSSPNIYSRIYKISGTRGSALKYPLPGRLSQGHSSWLNESEYKKLEELHTPALVKHIGALAKDIGGHGGMDFLMDWRIIDNLRNGLPMDLDVYDAAAWSALAPITERSVAQRGRSVNLPDFTRGNWKTNQPVDLSLQEGATTAVLPPYSTTTH